MNLSLTTDYVTGTGNPYPYLKAIAQAGFSHVHWCHEWSTDWLYPSDDVRMIGDWLRELGLSLLNLHASAGVESRWVSVDEARRRAGIALVLNRMEMASALGSDTIILHLPGFDGQDPEGWLEPTCRSLDALEGLSTRQGVRIALENVGNDANWAQMHRLFKKYPATFLGLCYDAGHGNFHAPSMGQLELLKDRLIAVHLHDNDGSGDQHLVPFYGSVDWPTLTRIVAQSSYSGCINLESVLRNHAGWDEPRFLDEAYRAGVRLTEMVARKAPCAKASLQSIDDA